MAVLLSGVWIRFLCIFCVVVIPEVWADYCKSYWDSDNKYNDLLNCEKYCCGDCNNRYCCKNKKDCFTLADQDNCSQRPTYEEHGDFAILVISLGTVVPIVVVLLCIIICCVVPGCLCYKCCIKRHRQRQIVVTNNVLNMPQPPYSPSGHQPFLPGYQAVPLEGSLLPSAPPPSYMESIGTSYPPTPYQPCAPPLPADEIVQPPYNPSYGPQL